jgi:hypothetical protein
MEGPTGTTHGTEELGLCPHGHAWQAGARGPLPYDYAIGLVFGWRGSSEVDGAGAPMAISSPCDAYESQTRSARLSAHRAPPDAIHQWHSWPVWINYYEGLENFPVRWLPGCLPKPYLGTAVLRTRVPIPRYLGTAVITHRTSTKFRSTAVDLVRYSSVHTHSADTGKSLHSCRSTKFSRLIRCKVANSTVDLVNM